MREDIVKEVVTRFKNNFAKNSKLGQMYSWSIPAKKTCPGKTDHCTRLCYVDAIIKRYPSVGVSYNRSYQISKHKSFKEIMIEALAKLDAGIMRIHVSGDFYSPKYTRDWFEILKASTHIKPFAFTRSWRIPEILEIFREYGTPPWLFASSDPETGLIPEGFREAAMSTELLRGIKKGIIPRPRLLCDEQFNEEKTCASCGRCPTFKLKDNELIQLPIAVVRNGVVFAQH